MPVGHAALAYCAGFSSRVGHCQTARPARQPDSQTAGQADRPLLLHLSPSCPQCDVDTQLRPRLAWLLQELPAIRAATALQRYPELLLVDSACLAERIAYLRG